MDIIIAHPSYIAHSSYHKAQSSYRVAQTSGYIRHPYYTGTLFQWNEKSSMDAYVCALKKCSEKLDMPKTFVVISCAY